MRKNAHLSRRIHIRVPHFEQGPTRKGNARTAQSNHQINCLDNRAALFGRKEIIFDIGDSLNV